MVNPNRFKPTSRPAYPENAMAQILGISAYQLRMWRSQNKGPAWTVSSNGRVFWYPCDAFQDYVDYQKLVGKPLDDPQNPGEYEVAEEVVDE